MEEAAFKFKCFANLAKFPGIIHGISKRADGNMKNDWSDKSTAQKNRNQFLGKLKINPSSIVCPQIVHGAQIALAGKSDIGKTIKGADGLITGQNEVFLMVTVADCFPIFIYDPLNKIIGLAHVGWRGIIDQIVVSIVGKIQNQGADTSNLIVGLGPGICQKHFVVTDKVLKDFQENYPKTTFVRNHDGYVDLRKAIVGDLLKAGVIKHNLEISHDCPACLNGLYGSFRKEGRGAPASAAVMGITSDRAS